MSTGVVVPSADRRAPSAGDRRSLRRRWVAATWLGETVGFLLPTAAVLAGADDPAVLAGADDPGDLLATAVLVAAGAGDGAVLGWAQAGVLGRVLPGFP